MSRASMLVAAIATIAATLALAPAASAKTYGATTLAVDPGAASALQQLGVTVTPLAPAKAGSAGLRFPITRSLGRSLKRGAITHRGGIALTAADGTRVELRNFTIDLRRHRLTAAVGASRLAILDLDFSKVRRSGRSTTGPVTARLTAGAAQALNQAFGVEAFAKGLKLGEATVRFGGPKR
jgi:hypothetical protein